MSYVDPARGLIRAASRHFGHPVVWTFEGRSGEILDYVTDKNTPLTPVALADLAEDAGLSFGWPVKVRAAHESRGTVHASGVLSDRPDVGGGGGAYAGRGTRDAGNLLAGAIAAALEDPSTVGEVIGQVKRGASGQPSDKALAALVGTVVQEEVEGAITRCFAELIPGLQQLIRQEVAREAGAREVRERLGWVDEDSEWLEHAQSMAWLAGVRLERRGAAWYAVGQITDVRRYRKAAEAGGWFEPLEDEGESLEEGDGMAGSNLEGDQERGERHVPGGGPHG